MGGEASAAAVVLALQTLDAEEERVGAAHELDGTEQEGRSGNP